eukprot:gene9515-10518_t
MSHSSPVALSLSALEVPKLASPRPWRIKEDSNETPSAIPKPIPNNHNLGHNLGHNDSLIGRSSVVDAMKEDETLARLPPRPFPQVLIPTISQLPRTLSAAPPPSALSLKYVAHEEVRSLLMRESETKSHPSQTSAPTVEGERSVSQNQYNALDHLRSQIEQLEYDLRQQKQHYESLLISKEEQYHALLSEKEARQQELQTRLESEQMVWRQQLHDKDRHYVDLLTNQERSYEEKLRQESQIHRERWESFQAQLSQEKDLQQLAIQARLEAKEEEVKQSYEKKLRKMEKLVQQTIEKYHEKELIIEGNIEESRREVKTLKETIELKEKHYKEHLYFQDKRLLEIQHHIDHTDYYVKLAEKWQSTAKDLASYVIRTCATVGELPYDFLAMQPRGDILARDVFADPMARDYDTRDKYVKFTRSEHVAVCKAQLIRALRLSKMIHERIKADNVMPSSPKVVA